MIDFIPAETLKRKYRVLGHFYSLKIGGDEFPCRSELEIHSVDRVTGLIPELVMVLMNPGSSRPKSDEYMPKVATPDEVVAGDFEREFAPAVPDPTQYQIMRLMELVGIRRVRVFNLCDLRNGNASGLKITLLDAKRADPSESFTIFHPSRLGELVERCRKHSAMPPFSAWGENAVLEDYAERALKAFPLHLGLARPTPWFCHPSPMLKTKKLEWLELAAERIERYREARE